MRLFCHQLSFIKKPMSSAGFTLIELIIVIVLMAILAISLSSITKNTVYGYIDAKDRNRFSQSAKWVIESITREAREALPQSVRASTLGNISCVEFLTIINSSSDLNLPATGAITSFNAVAFDLLSTPAPLIAIMPIDPASVYNLASGTLGNVAAIAAAGAGQVSITLTAPTTFANRSPNKRFYLLSTPVAYCLNNSNGQLTRYEGQDITIAQEFPPTSGAVSSSLVGEDFFASGNVFNYQPGTLSRAGLLQINLGIQNRSRSLSGNEESFVVFHEVHIRNVP